MTNQTTNEYIKKHWNIESSNPYYQFITIFILLIDSNAIKIASTLWGA
jgi:hypothetical protein